MLRNKLFAVLYIDNRSFVVVQSDFSALAQPQLGRKTTIALPL